MQSCLQDCGDVGSQYPSRRLEIVDGLIAEQQFWKVKVERRRMQRQVLPPTWVEYVCVQDGGASTKYNLVAIPLGEVTDQAQALTPPSPFLTRAT
jgi:hypothetical protein